MLVLALSPALAAPPKVIVDNAKLRAAIVEAPADQKTALHQHPSNRVMVYLDDGATRNREQNGRVTDIPFRRGKAIWSPVGAPHISENAGGKPYRVIEIELRSKGAAFRPAPLDPVRVAPQLYKVLFDNPQVRVLHVVVPAGGKVPMHEHGLDRLIVYLTPAKVRLTMPDGKQVESTAGRDDVKFSGPGSHAEENLASQPFEVVVVELK